MLTGSTELESSDDYSCAWSRGGSGAEEAGEEQFGCCASLSNCVDAFVHDRRSASYRAYFDEYE